MNRVAHGTAGKGGGRPFREAGFSIAELVVVIAVIGLLSVISIPFFLSYYQAAAARADVQQVITLFNQARELAIRQNDRVCVNMPTNQQMVFLLNNCAGTAWTGAGTDSAGNINLPPGFTISPLTNVIFDYLGAAPSGATTYTMTNSTTGATSTISIALTGRVTSP